MAVRGMPLERIQLVLRHHLQEILHFLLGEEMPAAIQQQPAPGEPRPVLDPHGRRRQRFRHDNSLRAEYFRRQQLQERLHPVKQSRSIRRGNHHAARFHRQRVAFRPKRGIRILPRQHDRLPPPFLSELEAQARALVQPGRQLFADVARIHVTGIRDDPRFRHSSQTRPYRAAPSSAAEPTPAAAFLPAAATHNNPLL